MEKKFKNPLTGIMSDKYNVEYNSKMEVYDILDKAGNLIMTIIDPTHYLLPSNDEGIFKNSIELNNIIKNKIARSKSSIKENTVQELNKKLTAKYGNPIDADELYKLEPGLDDPYFPSINVTNKLNIKRNDGYVALKYKIKGKSYLCISDPKSNDTWYALSKDELKENLNNNKTMNKLDLKESSKAKLFAAIKDTQLSNPYANVTDNNKRVSLNMLKKKGLLKEATGEDTDPGSVMDSKLMQKLMNALVECYDFLIDHGIDEDDAKFYLSEQLKELQNY